MADGKKQLALRLEHAPDLVGHAVDAAGQITELVAARDVEPVIELARADALDARLNSIDRTKQRAGGVVQHYEHEQKRAERQPQALLGTNNWYRERVGIGAVAHRQVLLRAPLAAPVPAHLA